MRRRRTGQIALCIAAQAMVVVDESCEGPVGRQNLNGPQRLAPAKRACYTF